MKLYRYLLYGAIWLVVLVPVYLYFPPYWSSGVKEAINTFLSAPLTYWWFIFPLIGLIMLLGFVLYYGVHFFASFGSGYKPKTAYYEDISILIASKNEKVLLERTLDSIVNSDYPKERMQIIVITSGSTDDTTDYANSFSQEHSEFDIKVLSKDLPKKGKPPAL
ncbi:MAG: glycosyltransferase, partial [Candidatus Hermodarchaeota archaeon]